MGVFHSHAFQDIYWEDDVLPAFIGFLQAHPSEVLIVSLKKKGESQDYASLLSVSLSIPAHQRYFVMDFRPELTVGIAAERSCSCIGITSWMIIRELHAWAGKTTALAC